MSKEHGCGAGPASVSKSFVKVTDVHGRMGNGFISNVNAFAAAKGEDLMALDLSNERSIVLSAELSPPEDLFLDLETKFGDKLDYRIMDEKAYDAFCSGLPIAPCPK